jgi:hypothetical protein
MPTRSRLGAGALAGVVCIVSLARVLLRHPLCKHERRRENVTDLGDSSR